MPTNLTTYKCMICDYGPVQKSHIESHLKNDKHKLQREIMKLKLEKLSDEQLLEKYEKTDIEQILNELENIRIKKKKEKKKF